MGIYGLGGGSTTRTPMTAHGFPAVVALGPVGVVGVTHQPDVRHLVVAPQAERVPMVEFGVVALLASSTLLVHVAALVSVALTHGALDGRGDVAGGGRRARLCLSHLRGTPAGSSRPPQATSLEPFELLGDGLFDDRPRPDHRRALWSPSAP